MKRKTTCLAALAVLFASSGAALTFDVSVGTLTDFETHFVKYPENTTAVGEIRLTAQNTGSIGCVYRLKGEFRYRNTTRVRYSRPYPLFPGELAKVQLQFIPENYTGTVQASLYSTYCDQEKFVENISFESLSRNVANNTVESETLTAGDESAEIKLPVERGILVPRESPPYWKASSARIENGSATLHYNPPIYDGEKRLAYTVVNGSGIVGETEVSLVVEETYWDRIKERLPRILGILLFYSLVLNTKLLYDRRSRGN